MSCTTSANIQNLIKHMYNINKSQILQPLANRKILVVYLTQKQYTDKKNYPKTINFN